MRPMEKLTRDEPYCLVHEDSDMQIGPFAADTEAWAWLSTSPVYPKLGWGCYQKVFDK